MFFTQCMVALAIIVSVLMSFHKLFQGFFFILASVTNSISLRKDVLKHFAEQDRKNGVSSNKEKTVLWSNNFKAPVESNWDIFDIPAFIRRSCESLAVSSFIEESDDEFAMAYIANAKSKAQKDSYFKAEQAKIEKGYQKVRELFTRKTRTENQVAANDDLTFFCSANDDLLNKKYLELPVSNTVPSGQFI